MTEYCVVSKSGSSFTYRMPDNYGGLSACAICHCYGDVGEWQNGNNGAIFRQVYSATSTSTLECTTTYSTEVACKSGYYDPREPDFMVYECYECPWLEDKYHTMLHGWTEYANTNTDITDCYIRKEDTATGVWFEDDTGQYAITDDCYYSL